MANARWRRAVVAVGLALAVLGAVAGSRYGLRSSTNLPIDDSAARAAFSALAEGLHCASVKGEVWSPLSGLEYTGRLAVTLPGFSGGELVMVLGDHFPLLVDVETVAGIDRPFRKERLLLGPGGVGPPPDYWLEEGTPLNAPQEVHRLTMPASAGGTRFISLRVGRRAPRVLARLSGYPKETRATICAARLGVPDAFAAGAAEMTILPQASEYFGNGWSGVEDLPDVGRIRFMRDHGAVLIPSARRGDVHVALEARLGVILGAVEPVVTLTVNDVLTLDERALRNGTHPYEWDIPARVWLEGTNELLFRVSWAPLGLQRLTLSMSAGPTVAGSNDR